MVHFTGLGLLKITILYATNLKVSDASHLDNLRTPLSKREIESEIEGISKEHWIFQKKLGFPILENGYLKFTSNSNFNVNEKRAWWLCYDALKVLDNELKKAEVYFLENNKKGFLAKGVKSIDNTLNLGENYIKTDDWKAIDTNIKVSNPKVLAANIGGKNLYNFSYFAIRELIQNSFDAISLRKIKEDNLEGVVKITLSLINDKYVLSITDNGIGMSKNVMCNQLLDFGNSYWNSYDFYDEYIGIAQEKFKTIGKFGIGFFSVFMLGSFVEISSLKYGESFSRVNKLVFENGLIANPTFTEVDNNFINSTFGTKVSIVLDKNPYTEGVLAELKCNDLHKLIRHLTPSPKYKIEIEELGNLFCIEKDIIDDNYRYNFKEILELTFTEPNSSQRQLTELAKISDLYLEPIIVNDIIVGQVGVVPKVTQIGLQNTGLVESNGIRVSNLSSDLIGYIKATEVTNLVRNQYDSGIPYESVFNWGVTYLNYMRSNQNKYDYKNLIEGLNFSLGLFNKSEYTSIYIENKKRMMPLNEITIVEYIVNSNELNYYDLMYGIDTDFEYKGIIQTIRPLSLNAIVTQADSNKFLSSFNTYLEKLIQEFWGSFKLISKSGFDDFPLDTEKLMMGKLPYMTKKTYLRH